MADKVTVKSCGKGGLQAQSVEVTLDQRRELIEALARSNVPELEIGSLSHRKQCPKWRGLTVGAKSPQRIRNSVPCTEYEGLRDGPS